MRNGNSTRNRAPCPRGGRRATARPSSAARQSQRHGEGVAGAGEKAAQNIVRQHVPTSARSACRASGDAFTAEDSRA